MSRFLETVYFNHLQITLMHMKSSHTYKLHRHTLKLNIYVDESQNEIGRLAHWNVWVVGNQLPQLLPAYISIEAPFFSFLRFAPIGTNERIHK